MGDNTPAEPAKKSYWREWTTYKLATHWQLLLHFGVSGVQGARGLHFGVLGVQGARGRLSARRTRTLSTCCARMKRVWQIAPDSDENEELSGMEWTLRKAR